MHPEMNSRDMADVAMYFDGLVRTAEDRGDTRHADGYREVAEEYRGHARKAMAREQRIGDIVRDMNLRRVTNIRKAAP